MSKFYIVLPYFRLVEFFYEFLLKAEHIYKWRNTAKMYMKQHHVQQHA